MYCCSLTLLLCFTRLLSSCPTALPEAAVAQRSAQSLSLSSAEDKLPVTTMSPVQGYNNIVQERERPIDKYVALRHLQIADSAAFYRVLLANAQQLLPVSCQYIKVVWWLLSVQAVYGQPSNLLFLGMGV